MANNRNIRLRYFSDELKEQLDNFNLPVEQAQFMTFPKNYMKKQGFKIQEEE